MYNKVELYSNVPVGDPAGDFWLGAWDTMCGIMQGLYNLRAGLVYLAMES